MSFDKPTRNLLAKMTAAARDRLAEDITAQLQSAYGLYPDSSRLDVAQTSEDRHATAELRALLDHFESAEPEGKLRKANAYQRLVREIGFTLLNRLAALRLCEERGLVIECVRAGMNSAGFQLYDRLAGGALGNRYQTYRAFIECMFDELAADLGALFDRRTPQSAVFPSEPAMNDLLALLNDAELTSRKIWQQDETIGWIYQYYNDPAERKKMREESQAPRNSRELAVRNQFFTPRYVVEFLTDNTLGRFWYEMSQGETRLTEQCRYLVQRRHPIFLVEGQDGPELYDPASASLGDPDLPGEIWVRPNPELESVSDIFAYAINVGGYDYAREILNVDCSELTNSRREQYRGAGKWVGGFEELRCCLFYEQRRYHHFGQGPEGEDALAILALYKAVCEQWDREVDVVPFRAKKDPRRLRVLDPACGSGHFLLYAFDLLETIYAEAYDDPGLGLDLRDSFPNRTDFVCQVPRLILENNLHGIDIDPRAAQIAALALWLRAQRAWQGQKLGATERPQVGRTHIVVAEPMPGDEGLLEEFIADLPKDQHPEIIGPLVQTVFEKMKLAGEAGSLLKIEEELKEVVGLARNEWTRTPQPEQLSFLPGQPKPKQMGLDLSGINDDSFWKQAEELVLRAMEEYARQAENGKGIRRRLFAGDASQGFAFIDLCRKRYDVILMNPPFGEASEKIEYYLQFNYSDWNFNLFCCFIARSLDLSQSIGTITDRAYMLKTSYEDYRKNRLLFPKRLKTIVDLGWGVLDANVEVNLQIFGSRGTQTVNCLDISYTNENRDEILLTACNNHTVGDWIEENHEHFESLPNSVISYKLPQWQLRAQTTGANITELFASAKSGLKAGRVDQFVRLVWEISDCDRGTKKEWNYFQNGSPYSPFYYPTNWVVYYQENWEKISSVPSSRITGLEDYWKPGLTYGKRTDFIYAYPMPSGEIFSNEGMAVFPTIFTNIWGLLGFINSPTCQSLMNLLAGQHKAHSYFNKIFLEKPINDPRLSSLAEEIFFMIWQVDLINETNLNFISPFSNGIDPETFSKVIDSSSINRICSLAGEKYKDLADIVSKVLNDTETHTIKWPSWGSVLFEEDITDQLLGKNVISYLFGCAFGRWDFRYSIWKKTNSNSLDPFAPLPTCPPGMLQNDQGLPIFSSDHTLDYPLPIPWDGILVDDPGIGEHPEPHQWDILRRTDHVLQLIWPESHEAITSEACQILDVKDLREYFRKPSVFFTDHLKRYSKSRRQAPIYWPLSTSSGSYTLWIYYQRLTSETLYIAVNRFVSPKIEQVERYLCKLEDDLTKVLGRSAGELRDKDDSTRAFLAELNEFRAELLRVANLPYQPDLNDGVIINAAPLYKLFRLTKWSKNCQAVWDKLADGEYDWAHMAYVLWPDRVREKCKVDKSLAIAHGLEELYQGVEKGKKRKSKKKIEEEQEGWGF